MKRLILLTIAIIAICSTTSYTQKKGVRLKLLERGDHIRQLPLTYEKSSTVFPLVMTDFDTLISQRVLDSLTVIRSLAGRSGGGYFDTSLISQIVSDSITFSNELEVINDTTKIKNETAFIKFNSDEIYFNPSKSVSFSLNNSELFQEPFYVGFEDYGNLLLDFGNSNHYIMRSQLSLNSGSDNTKRVGAILGQAVINNTSMSDVVAVYGNVKNESGNVTNQRAGYFANVTNGSGSATNSTGINVQVTNTGSGTVTEAEGVSVSAVATGTMNKFTGFKVGAKSGNGIGTFLAYVNDEPTGTSYTRGGWVIGSSNGLMGSHRLVINGDGVNDPIRAYNLLEDDTANKLWASDADGILKLKDVSSITGTDNLGNHTATQNINLNGNKLVDGGTLGLQVNSSGQIAVGTNPASARFRVQGIGSEIGAYIRANSSNPNLHTLQAVQQGSAGCLFAQNTGTGLGIQSTTASGTNFSMTQNGSINNALNKYQEVSVQASISGGIDDSFGAYANYRLQNPTGSSNDVYRQSYGWMDATNTYGRMAIAVRGGVSSITDNIIELSSDNIGRKIDLNGKVTIEDRLGTPAFSAHFDSNGAVVQGPLVDGSDNLTTLTTVNGSSHVQLSILSDDLSESTSLFLTGDASMSITRSTEVGLDGGNIKFEIDTINTIATKTDLDDLVSVEGYAGMQGGGSTTETNSVDNKVNFTASLGGLSNALRSTTDDRITVLNGGSGQLWKVHFSTTLTNVSDGEVVEVTLYRDGVSQSSSKTRHYPMNATTQSIEYTMYTTANENNYFEIFIKGDTNYTYEDSYFVMERAN